MDWLCLVLAITLCFCCSIPLTDIYSSIKSGKKKDKVKIPEYLSGQEALECLCRQILTDDYYIPDPVSTKQANSIIVKDILKKFGIEALIVIEAENKENKEIKTGQNCPFCGSKNLGYLSFLSNYAEVKLGFEEPVYKETVICQDCQKRFMLKND